MVHQHITASDTWEVVHGLNTQNPSVTCWVDLEETLSKIVPLSVDVKDKNTVIITFTRPYTGEVSVSNEKRWSDD